jgi:hypothetical protein
MLVVAITAMVIAAVGHAGGVLIQHQRARSAADAAALAAVTGGPAAAEEMCRANGCRVVQLRSVAGRVDIVIEVAGVHARSSASS